MSAELKAGAITLPAGEYTIGVIKNSDKDWTMALYPGTLARGTEPDASKIIKLDSQFTDAHGTSEHMTIDITPGHGKQDGKAVLLLHFGKLYLAGFPVLKRVPAFRARSRFGTPGFCFLQDLAGGSDCPYSTDVMPAKADPASQPPSRDLIAQGLFRQILAGFRLRRNTGTACRAGARSSIFNSHAEPHRVS